MQRSAVPTGVLAALAVIVVLRPSPHAQTGAALGGVWSLNRSLSDVPQEIGFNADWFPAPDSAGRGAGSTGGGRGRRGAGGSTGGAFPVVRESYLDAQRLQLVTSEARTPPSRLMIVDTPAAVTITNELGQSRTLHPNGRQESIEIQGVLIPVTAMRDGDRLAVVYHVERDREVHYTYSRAASPPQLVVEVQFVERGAGDKAKFVYLSGVETTTAAPERTAPQTPSSSQAPMKEPPRETFDERPGAELRGLRALGILVEDLSAQATACGLNHDAIEASLSKRLTDAGFTVRRNSDEDTYLYVNVMSSSSGGTCVSRYDAFLYTHATANLTYRDRPVLVQVSLMHRGGMGSSAPSAHSALVVRGLEAYVDTFISQVRDANR
jgi:hypothetical protein